MSDELQMFFEAMIYKLHKNHHKGKWENVSILDLEKLLLGEVEELKEAIRGGNSLAMILEAADVGNFAMMMSSVAMGFTTYGE